MTAEADREDYQEFLEEYGFTQEFMDLLVHWKADRIAMPVGWEGQWLKVKPSLIQGLGLFTEKQLVPNTGIALARYEGKRTPAGRFVNHSGKPNAVYIADREGDLLLVSKTLIMAGKEITIDYRQAGEVNGAMVETQQAMELFRQGKGLR